MEEVTYVADAVALDIEGFKDCVSEQSPIPDDHHDDGEEAHMAEVTCAADTVAVGGEGCEDSVGYISSSISNDDEEEAHLSFKREDLNPNWVSSIKQKNLLDPKILKASSASKSCSIHRVPFWLRKHNPNAYDPQFISIGPFHYKKRKGQLRAMEEHKWRYLRGICSMKPEGWLEDCLATIKRLEERARNYYSEVIAPDSDSFVEMMVLDGCFMIELFCKVRLFHNDNHSDDAIIRLEWTRKALFFYLLLMENQIPFFILQRLSGLIDASRTSPAFVESALFFLLGLDHSKVIERINDSKIRHLLHLLHASYVLFPSECKDPRQVRRIPCASKLEEVGITFRKRDVAGDESGFLDIKFEKGVIEIPSIEIWDKTQIEFLNLIAFEQCYLRCKKYITAYTSFMDWLINTPKDAEILCQKEIIENGLGNEELVAAHFNNVAKEAIIFYGDFYLSDVCEKINQYSERTWPKLRASLVHDYFKNPWAIISFIAAHLLLLQTLAQTFFTSFPKFAHGN